MKNKNDKISDILFVLPQFILYFLLTIIPFLLVIFYMFTDVVSVSSNTFNFIGLGNFKEIFSPRLFPKFFDVVRRTVIIMLINYSTVFTLGLTLALIAYEKVIKAQKAFNIMIFMPYVISGIAAGMFLPLLFNPDTGSLNLLLMKLGWINEEINIKTKLGSIIGIPLVVGWRYAGYNMAIFLLGLASIPEDTINASKIDGASYFQRLRYIYLPQIVPSIILVTVSCLIGSFGIFGEPVGMGGLAGNENAQVFSLLLFRMGTQAQMGTMSMGMALSFIVNIPLVLIALYLLKLQKKLQY